jgi:probable HAF family extracellular repeat protein
MKCPLLNSIWALSLLAALAMPVQLSAQEQSTTQGSDRYIVTDLGPVGPVLGQAYFITNNNLISGAAAAADGSMHATLWIGGVEVDMSNGGGFGGPNSLSFGGNQKGQSVGGAETSNPDPDGEDFCGFAAMGIQSSGTCLPFVWKRGVMTPLPTLGGNNGIANQINSRGVVAGQAETAIRDKHCPGPQRFNFRPVVWEQGQIRRLPTVSGDPEGVALAINESGDVAGASGTCSTFSPTLLINLSPLHAVLWENGKPTDLGSLGGQFGNVALNLNNKGQVVGASDLTGDATSHAFLWTSKTGMQDLGTLPGDVISAGLGINDSGEIVGVSLDQNFNLHAYIRRHGHMTDLNDLITGDSSLLLVLPCSINARGEITGLAVDTRTGEPHGFLATPVHSAGGSVNAGPAVPGSSDGTKAILSEDVRQLLQQRLPFGRFMARPRGSQ